MVIENRENIVPFMSQVIVTDQDIDDILCTAVEGGINYWCEYYNGHPPFDEDGNQISMVLDYNYEYLSRGGSLTLVVKKDHIPDPRGKDNDLISTTRVLSKSTFKKGVELYINKYAPELIRHKRNGDGKNVYKLELGSLDAGDCDNIVQFACFGEVRYG